MSTERKFKTQGGFQQFYETLLFGLQVVLKLTQMIGKNVKLYDMVLQFLRTLFLRTRNVHYCTLRAELLMSLHDLDISEICSVDPCHKASSHPQTPTLGLPSLLNPLVFVVTVHLVSGRLHPREVCGQQTSQRAAGFPGRCEEGPGAGPRVTNGFSTPAGSALGYFCH